MEKETKYGSNLSVRSFGLCYYIQVNNFVFGIVQLLMMKNDDQNYPQGKIKNALPC